LFLALLQDTGSLGVGSHHLHQFHLHGRQVFARAYGSGLIGMSSRGVSGPPLYAREDADQNNDDRKSQDYMTQQNPQRQPLIAIA